MIFTLETLPARHGDALLLHYGPADDPGLIIIDGGPAGVARQTLLPRLQEVRQARQLSPDDSLPVRLLLVSHIDDDHIRGVLDLTDQLCEAQDDQRPLPYQIQALWHNSFDDIVGGSADAAFQAASAAVASAAAGGAAVTGALISLDGALLLASVPQGRRLRDNASKLGLAVNAPLGMLVLAQTAAESPVPLGHGLRFRILGPSRQRIAELQAEWDQILRRENLARPADFEAEAAAYVDNSVYNLASIVVLAQADSKTMLLTGDARGDDILAGLDEAGLLTSGRPHVDVLKVPHHGSERNLDTDFFRRVTADYYVFSADGRHGNPDLPTFRMLFTARGGEPFTIGLTYPVPEFGHDYPIQELLALFEQERAAGKNFTVLAPLKGGSLRIELLEPVV